MKKIITVLSLMAVLVLGLGIYKVNGKINSLATTVQAMQEENQQDPRLDMIPDLDPQGTGWKVTQFGDATKDQENCYTITTESGLVIVDGGCNYEVPRLRKIIAQYGNSVEAWILTHPHPDHINAFMTIYNDPQGVVINHIYTAEHPSEELMKENADWDDYSALEQFRQMDIPLEFVHTGDELNLLGGLKVEILSAYSDRVDELSDDLMNDGAIMFRISGEKDSMLFCSDVGKALTEELIDTYGEKLKSDYVQMEHHGYGGPKAAFYELVAPKAAFFDAPAWLINSDSKRSTKKKMDLMESMGCTIFTFFTAPNQIIIQ